MHDYEMDQSGFGMLDHALYKAISQRMLYSEWLFVNWIPYTSMLEGPKSFVIGLDMGPS